MEKYVFYFKEGTSKVFAESTLDKDDIKKLKKEGFKKHHLDFFAESKQDAITKLNAGNQENLDALREFSGNHMVMVVILLITLVVTLLNWNW